MTGKIHVEISSEPINIATAHAFVSDPAHGAINSFVGVVRDLNLGRDVVGVSYDVFEPLAHNVLYSMCKKVCDTYSGKINIYIAHYKGRLDVGGVSVAIVVSTPHRAESFSACRSLIEELKKIAPIWKQEHYVDGDSEWVKGHALCQHEQDTDHKKHAHG